MAYCRKCGALIDDEAVICPKCGVQVKEYVVKRQSYASTYDSGSFGWGVLGFFFPLIGLILYIVWKDNKPRSASVAGKGALWSVIVDFVLFLLVLCAGAMS